MALKGPNAVSLRVRARFEQVTGAADSLEEAGIFRVGFDFFAQTANANVDATRRNEWFIAPDRGEQFFASEDAAGMRGHVVEEAELEEAGGNVPVRTGDAIQSEVNKQIVELKGLPPFGSRFSAPQKKFHTGNEFARAERLGDVIVGACFKGGDEVGFTATGRENDNWQAVEQKILADLGKNAESGDAGEHGVEEQKVRRSLLDGRET